MIDYTATTTLLLIYNYVGGEWIEVAVDMKNIEEPTKHAPYQTLGDRYLAFNGQPTMTVT